MVAGAFPLIKLGALAFRQIAKPLANALKVRAKKSPFFSKYICMPPAQAYHWMEVNVKMKLLGLGKPSSVQKLNESMAIELGAEMLGEFIIFMAAVITISLEYVRQSRKSAAEAQALEDRWTGVESRIEELEFLVDQKSAELRELTRLLYSIKSNPNIVSDKKSSDNKDNNTDSKGLIGRAITEATDKLKGKQN